MSSLATRFQWSASSTNSTPITNTVAATIQAAPSTATVGQTGSQIALTDLYIVNNSATVSTLINILAGATVVFTGYLPASTAALVTVPLVVNFQTPIQCGKGNALTIQAVTTGANIYWNAAGFFFNS